MDVALHITGKKLINMNTPVNQELAEETLADTMKKLNILPPQYVNSIKLNNTGESLTIKVQYNMPKLPFNYTQSVMLKKSD